MGTDQKRHSTIKLCAEAARPIYDSNRSQHGYRERPNADEFREAWNRATGSYADWRDAFREALA